MIRLVQRFAGLVRERRPMPRGQALVELSLLLPVLLTIVLGTLEFGFVFDHHLSLEYATREGARVGAALANGSLLPDGVPCASTPVVDLTVDAAVIAAVERVLVSDGSPVKKHLDRIGEIRIYQADAGGGEVGPVNKWIYAAGAGPIPPGSLTRLDFRPTSQTWFSCSRSNGASPDSIGVSLTYTYDLQTPLAALFSWATIGMSDRTVMQLNPSK